MREWNPTEPDPAKLSKVQLMLLLRLEGWAQAPVHKSSWVSGESLECKFAIERPNAYFIALLGLSGLLKKMYRQHPP